MSLGDHVGVVRRFDAEEGLGEVEDEHGNRWLFHCTAIADGTRMIDVGTKVNFVLSAGGPGRWEAFAISG